VAPAIAEQSLQPRCADEPLPGNVALRPPPFGGVSSFLTALRNQRLPQKLLLESVNRQSSLMWINAAAWGYG
jgi:hypothetical protein